MGFNSFETVPPEIGQLTSLKQLRLVDNLLLGFPAELRTLDPEDMGDCTAGTGIQCVCDLRGNPGDSSGNTFSCANVGHGTTCCTADNCGNVGTCFNAPTR